MGSLFGVSSGWRFSPAEGAPIYLMILLSIEDSGGIFRMGIGLLSRDHVIAPTIHVFWA